jgi:hypothetical protein
VLYEMLAGAAPVHWCDAHGHPGAKVPGSGAKPAGGTGHGAAGRRRGRGESPGSDPGGPVRFRRRACPGTGRRGNRRVAAGRRRGVCAAWGVRRRLPSPRCR